MTGNLTERPTRSFAFGPFVLIPERQLLLKGEVPVRIGSRAMDILTALVERPGELVSKRELFSRAWPDTFVEEGNLKVNMVALRRVLGEGPGKAQYIATVTGRGYRFVASVLTGESAGPVLASTSAAAGSHDLPTGPTRILGRADAIEAIGRDLDESRARVDCRRGRHRENDGRDRRGPCGGTGARRRCRVHRPCDNQRLAVRTGSRSRRRSALV